MTRSVAIIGAGQIGYSACWIFLGQGYDVRVLARSRPDWMFADAKFESYLAGRDPAPSADVVIDTIAFDEEDVARYDPGEVGQLITVSSASVYCDDQGRTLDEASQNGFPEFDGPINEEQSTVAPGPETYSTRKVRMENKAVELFGNSATILRPCAIHGKYSRHPREWWFVKRLKDRRRRIPLVFNGASRFQTTHSDSIGSFAADAAEKGLGGVFNIADEGSPSVLEIGKIIFEQMNRKSEFFLLADSSAGPVGRTPWSVPKPFIVANSKAAKHCLDFDPYFLSIEDSFKWLNEHTANSWQSAFPQLAAYPYNLFDYEAEDAYFAALK